MIPILTATGSMNAKLRPGLSARPVDVRPDRGARIGKLHRRLKKDDALAHMPTLPADRLPPPYLYYDAQADDAGSA
jgi:glycerol-3-phosphate dehydrogenase